MKNHSFTQIFKEDVEVVQWKAEVVFAELLTVIEGARYPYRRGATHMGHAMHMIAPASDN